MPGSQAGRHRSWLEISLLKPTEEKADSLKKKKEEKKKKKPSLKMWEGGKGTEGNKIPGFSESEIVFFNKRLVKAII